MQLFTVEKNKVTPKPEALLIKEFRLIWDSDRTKEKDAAIRELGFVYFKGYYKSPYLSYNPKERDQAIIEDLFSKSSKWQPNDLTEAAVQKYIQLQKTPTMNLLLSQRHALNQLEEYYYSVDLKAKDRDGKLVHDVNKLTKSMGDSARISDSLDKLEDRIRREQKDNQKNRGGEESALFEDSDMDD